MSKKTSIQSGEKKIDDLNKEAWNIRVKDSPYALTLSKQALELARNISYTKGIADAMRTQAFCYGRLSRYDEALALLKESLSLYESLNDIDGQSNVIEYMGFIHRNQGELGTALKLLYKALSFAEQTGFPENLATGHYQLGVTYKHLGDYEKALDHLYQSITINREMNNSLYEAYSINVIGSIYFDNGNYEQALDYYKQGLVARHQSGDKWGEAGSLDNIGFAYLKLKDYKQAIDNCKQSLAISRSTDDKRGQANVLLHLAEIYRETNDTKQAAKFSNESLEIRKASGDKRGEAEIHLFLADLHKNETAESNRVFEWLNNALKIAEEIKAHDLLSKARLHLYGYYKQQGNYEEALKNLDLHYNLEKEFHKNSINQKVLNLEITHKAEEARKEAEAEKLRNKELMELNEQIENANAELKIESSLERVRTAAMAMKKAEELVNVSEVMFNELVSLGVANIRNAQIAIENEQKQSFITYVHSDTEPHAIRETPYSSSSLLLKAKQSLSTSGAFYQTEYKGKDLEEWRKWKRNMGGPLDERELSTTSLQWYLYAIGKGHMGLSTYDTINPEQVEIVKRFKNVFELSYQRFDDLQKAEAQAREAQVEAALERVRAKVMAMNNSKDLDETSLVFGEQLRKLGIDWQFSYFWLIDEAKNQNVFWITWPDHKTSFTSYTIAEAEEYFNDCLIAWRGGVTIHDNFVPPDDVQPWLDTFQRIADNAGGEAKRVMVKETFREGVFYYDAMMRYGSFGICISKPATEEEKKVQCRFATEFERAYTRFLDLKQAEAQAREAEIELGLERVRARAMAMQRSDELSDLVDTVFKELTRLDFALTWCIINIIDEPSLTNTVWAANPGIDKAPESYLMKFEDYPFHHAMMKGWKERNTKCIYVIEGEEKKIYDEYLFNETEFRRVPPEAQAASRAMERYVVTFTFSNFGGLQTVGDTPLSDASIDILSRFGKVFDLTYTRFNDLKLAEEQARESQIQLALERVRARTMAMQHSNELQDAAILLFEQMKALGVHTGSCGFNIWDKKEKSAMVWMSSSEGGLQTPFTLPHTESAIYKQVYEAMEKGEDFLVKEVSGEQLKKHFDYLLTLPGIGSVIKKLKETGYSFPETMVYHFVFFSQGYLSFHLHEHNPGYHDIFKRFAKVFEQTYTRFLDLQKAEAQAREAQIQLALERVRARTMAMHHSDEITEVVKLLYQEFDKLKINNVSTDIEIGLIDEETGIASIWAHFYLSDGAITTFQFPIAQFPGAADEYKKWQTTPVEKRNELFFTTDFSGEKWDKIIDWVNKTPELADIFQPMIDAKITRWVTHNAYFSHGMLTLQGTEPYSPETQEIQKRFTKVFEQTYTRFLDLQKAEAQAREARIEAALEKVRSRSLAMHTAEELGEVVKVIVEKLKELDVVLDANGVVLCTYFNDSKNVLHWIVSPDFSFAGSYLLPYFDHPIFNAAWDSKEKGDDYFSKAFSVDEKNSFFEYAFEHSDYKYFPDEFKRWVFQNDKHSLSFAWQKNSAILIPSHTGVFPTETDKTILIRFAKVFEQAYVRFMDLQKAEAQAREAQIEAALERVRSRSMGMQKSEELKEVIQIVYEQLVHLNIHTEHAGFIMDYKTRDDLHIWLADQHLVPSEVTIPWFDSPPNNSIKEAKEKGLDFCTYHLNFEEKNKFYQDLFKFIPGVPEETIRYYLNCPGLAGSCVLLENIVLYIENFSGTPYTDEEHEVLMRFGKVFQQTYTRFLDLQKAEAQARESQIQLALERARAQSMMMQHSKELDDTLRVFHEQVLLLGIKSAFSFLWLPDEEKDRHIFWAAWAENDSTVFKSKAINYPLDRNEPATGQCLIDWKSNQPVISYHVPPAAIESYFAVWQELISGVEQLKPENFSDGLYYVEAFIKYGCFGVMVRNELTEDEKKILYRFAVEFERTYTRFLDLKKAEAQAKEAQIEAALEKIRSRSLAMHKSEELKHVIAVVFEKLKEFGLAFHASGIYLFKGSSKDSVLWVANSYVISEPLLINLPYNKDALENSELFNQLWKARQAGEDIYNKSYSFEEKNKYFQYVGKYNNQIPLNVQESQLKAPSYTHSVIMEKNSGLMTDSWLGETLSIDEFNLLKRVAKVFEQAYTRFLDLQKAEAQAREAEIELALERVRARAMAMQHPTEFVEVVNVMGEQFINLGFDIEWANFGANGFDVSEGIDTWNFAVIPGGDPISSRLFIPYFDHPLFIDAKKQLDEYRRTGNDFFEMTYGKDVKDQWLDHLFVKTIFKEVPNEYRAIQYEKSGYTTSNLILKDTWLSIGKFDARSFTDEQHAILRRFGKAFGQAYTRFLDLQKAEAQAREAEIELALERVRARTMAMQKSDELQDIVHTVFERLKELNIDFYTAIIILFNEDSKDIVWWLESKAYQNYQKIQVPYADFSYMQDLVKARENKIDFIEKKYSFEEKNQLFHHLFAHTELKHVPQQQQEFLLGTEFATMSVSLSKNTGLHITSYSRTSFSDRENDIFKRFAKVFDQAYTRFLDLQKAEAQAREAKIETALEKVRASTMAMQKSEDLSKTAFVLFNQFKELGAAPERIFIATFDDHDSGVVDLWGTDQGGNQLNKLFRLPVNEPTMVSKIIAAWKEKKRSVVVDLKGEELKTYLGFLKLAGIPVTEGVMTERRVQTAACFSNGVIGVTTPEPQSAEAVQLQERFAGVFDLTYTRFLDLQKAEAQAHEAKIETALERVRARALAMQEPEELKDVAQVLRSEMGLLGVEELETCSIYIHEKDSETAECWYALKDPKETEKKMVADHFHLELNETWVGKEMKKFYSSEEKKTSIVMQGENRKEWIAYCYKHSPVFSGFYGETIPDRTYHLYKFSHGYIGAAAPGEISAESWKLLRRAASVFSLAYSRFKDLTQARNDLIKLKEEKTRAEDALTELQATQKQLIQSEKMASLGELTAGIAHEIQNPLNFVNNFSDVSNELIEELRVKSEKLKIEDEEVKDLLDDISQNLEKISHHGKRADAIVKGMLQHSRSSSGQKEPTDINSLAEEYLRLAYHGLRAKDKFFNAKFETDLDPSIEKINIVPQEIGRVILNLINNSFYAVNEKKRTVSNGYEPSVAISTKKVDDRIEVKVKDNGNGIPKNVLDKIFQPFFTTKPTGQGTGLGLSLSYDIVTKGHDGEIKVETKEGEGSEFIISLPVK